METIVEHSVGIPRRLAGGAKRRLRLRPLGLLALGIVTVSIMLAVFAPLLAPYDPARQDVASIAAPPGPEHLMGTDGLGRDVLSRLIYGGRISILVGFVSIAVAFLAGVPVGLVAGFYGGSLDVFLMRVIDVILGIPRFLLAVLLVYMLGTEIRNIMLAIGLWSAPLFARTVRASVLSLKQQEYIHAARAIGARDGRIIIRHILPNALGPLVVISTLGVAGAVLAESGLSYLGLGIQPPTASWGVMVSEGTKFLLVAPHIATFSGAAIFATVLSLTVLGEELREALDPRLRGRQ